MSTDAPPRPALRQLRRRARSVVLQVVVVGVGVFLLWYASVVWLLAFAGVLLAAFLRALSDPLARRTALSDRAALALVIGALAIALGGLGWFLANDVLTQLSQLAEELPRALGGLEETVRRYTVGARLLDQLGRVEGWILERPVVSRASSFVSSTVALLSGTIVVLFIGLFLALDPHLYARGFLLLLPRPRRARGRVVLDTIAHVLRWWLVGKVAEMAIIATATWLGLRFIGLEPSLALGIIAGLLAFIPYLGPVFSFAPALLLALVQGPTVALQVVLLYGGIQLVESNLLTPFIERKTVLLPPALTLVSQALFALLFGFLGILLASPLTAVGLLLVKMLYVEDVLGEEVEPI